jgi:hypothetical protein
MMVMMWPAIPMFLIQLHFKTDFWRRLGIWTYFVVILEWIPIAFILYSLREIILQVEIQLPSPFMFLVVILIVAGIVLHTHCIHVTSNLEEWNLLMN